MKKANTLEELKMFESIEKGLLDRVGAGIFLSLFITVLGSVWVADFVSDYLSQFLGMFTGIMAVSLLMLITWVLREQLEKEEY